MAARVISAIRDAASREPTRTLAIAWVSLAWTLSLAFGTTKVASIVSVARNPIGRVQLQSEWGPVQVVGWLWSDVVTAVLMGGVLALVFGWSRRRRARLVATGFLALALAAVAVLTLVAMEVYRLFGAVPTWQLLDSLSDARNATDSVGALLDAGKIATLLALIALLAGGTLLLRRLLERRERLARRLAVTLVAVFVATGAAQAMGQSSRFELHRNAFLTFGRSAIFGPEAGGARGLASFDGVLSPVIGGNDDSVPAGYDELKRWAKRKPNVVLIILETMAVSHMHLFGAEAENTPTLEQLAAEGILWPRYYSHAPSSMFSIYSILCSNHGKPQAAHITASRPRIDCKSISEILSAKGYRAGLFHSGRHSYSKKDLFFAGRGYEVLYDTQSMPNRERYQETSWGIEEKGTLAALVDWLDKGDGDAPFFVTYIPVYPHHPYPVPDPRFEMFSGPHRKYRNSVYYIDQMVSSLLDSLRERGLLEDTLVVMMGDHGEGFGEHPGSKMHGSKLYDEAVHTFALWYAPGAVSGGVVDDRPFGHVDVAPTLLDLLGLEVPRTHIGTSALVGRGRPMVPLYTGYGHPLVGFVDGRYKFILNRRSGDVELYDLVSDPGERSSIHQEKSEWIEVLTRRGHDFVAAQKAWEGSLPDLVEGLEVDFEGEDVRWTLDPADCTFPKSHFEAKEGELYMKRAGEKTVVCRRRMPAGRGVVTAFQVRGIETYNGAFITGMAVWKKGATRKQVAYCTLNGNNKRKARSCSAKLVPGATDFESGGALEIELRYVTTEPRPDFERFSVDSVVVDYRIAR